MVISGRKLARQIRQEARHEVQQWVAAGNKRPHLSVVLVGENPASHSYVLNKTKAAADVGESGGSRPEKCGLVGNPRCWGLFGVQPPHLVTFHLPLEFGFSWLPGCTGVWWVNGICWILQGSPSSAVGVFQLSQRCKRHRRGFLASFSSAAWDTAPVQQPRCPLTPAHLAIQSPARGQGQ